MKSGLTPPFSPFASAVVILLVGIYWLFSPTLAHWLQKGIRTDPRLAKYVEEKKEALEYLDLFKGVIENDCFNYSRSFPIPDAAAQKQGGESWKKAPVSLFREIESVIGPAPSFLKMGEIKYSIRTPRENPGTPYGHLVMEVSAEISSHTGPRPLFQRAYGLVVHSNSGKVQTCFKEGSLDALNAYWRHPCAAKGTCTSETLADAVAYHLCLTTRLPGTESGCTHCQENPKDELCSVTPMVPAGPQALEKLANFTKHKE